MVRPKEQILEVEVLRWLENAILEYFVAIRFRSKRPISLFDAEFAEGLSYDSIARKMVCCCS